MTDIAVAEARAAADRRHRGLTPILRPVLDGNTFTVELPITPQMRKSRLVSPRRDLVPTGVAGDFTADDGHVVRLVDDTHGIRLCNLGPRIVSTLLNGDGMLRLVFDTVAKRVAVSVVSPSSVGSIG